LAYIYAKHLGLTHLVTSFERTLFWVVVKGHVQHEILYRRLPKQDRIHSVTLVDEQGLTALVRAALYASAQLSETDLRAGADMEICDPIQGTAALMSLAAQDSTPLSETLWGKAPELIVLRTVELSPSLTR
jgi:hypothetical protein